MRKVKHTIRNNNRTGKDTTIVVRTLRTVKRGINNLKKSVEKVQKTK